AVIRYGLWLRGFFETLDNGKERVARGFEEMPEVRAILERHLDPVIDPSRAIRATYGRWLPWIQLLDRSWTEANLTKIFPRQDELRNMHASSWETYITTSDVYNEVFDLLQDEYSFAIAHLGESVNKSHLGDPDERLAQHLMVLYWRGRLRFEEKGGLLERFF